jgi:hypothetical protein
VEVADAAAELEKLPGVAAARGDVDPPTISSQLILAVVLTLMGVLIFVAVAVAASTRLGQATTLLVCVAVYALGTMHPYLFGRYAGESVVARVLGWLLPKMSFFYAQLDTLLRDVPIPPGYVYLAAAYSAAYIAAVLLVGMALFQRRPLEVSSSSATLPGAVGLIAWVGRAAAVALAIAALVLLSLEAFHTAVGLATAGGMLVAAPVCWLLWGGFGRGRKWAYWLVLLASVAVLGGLHAGYHVPGEVGRRLHLGQAPVLLILEHLVAAAVILVLVLPKTRRHFFSAGS